MKKLLYIGIPFLLLMTAVLVRCAGEDEKPDPIEPIKQPVPAQISAPNNDEQYTLGETVEVKLKFNAPEGLSNLQIMVDDSLFQGNLSVEDQTIIIPTNGDSKVGPIKVKLSYTDADGKARSDNRTIVFFSDITPGVKTAKILQTFNHEKTSYTQGLEFYEGKLYEGTGQYGKSVLAEVDVFSGKKVREHALDGGIFGEGITILKDTIYQITYRSEICYLYDMDFNQIGSFSYEGQGWGLCNNGKELIMSNGSTEIVWRNAKTFEIVKRINVFDENTSVAQLNELELINGRLFVNLYTEDRIAEVDTNSGKILNYINCAALTVDAMEPGNDVLNGIAHNPLTGKTYMTGKLWPKLFEVAFE